MVPESEFVDSVLFDLITLDKIEEAKTLLTSAQLSQENKESALWYRDTDSVSPLHIACTKNDLELVRLLIHHGHTWNVVDAAHVSAGEYALKANLPEIYEFMVAEGVRTEFILGSLSTKVEDSNSLYLSSKLTYTNGLLVDAEMNAVMMGWETPIMQRHVDVLCTRKGMSVMNVGFGLGIIDKMIQLHEPERHVIIEAHPDVYAHMLEQGWDKIKGVEIFFGKWQDVIEEVGCFDAIFFDTFGEFYDDLKGFHEHVPNLLLNEESVYSFFNGLAGTNLFFHEVYNHVAAADLFEMGVTTEYVDIEVDALGDEIWKNMARVYYSLRIYQLPICKLTPQ